MMLCARICFVLPALAVAAAAAETKTSHPKSSPFLPANTAAAPAAAANDSLEFAGISAVGKRTDVILHDKAAKKNRWIGVGETKDGIKVVRYDAAREQVLVDVDGTEKLLQLRKGSGTVSAPVAAMPAPLGLHSIPGPVSPAQATDTPVPPLPVVQTTPAVPAATAPAPQPTGPATAEEQRRAETEARMLVSDLLEIGMAQRKAYEEARRRAAQGETAPPPAAATPKQ